VIDLRATQLSKVLGNRRFAWALFALALAPRLFVALSWAEEPVWDGHYYDFGARRIAEGLGYSDDIFVGGVKVWHPWCHYPVGYSAFLGLFYRVFGASSAVAAVVNSLVGSLVALVTYRLAGTALSEPRARLAGALVALHPGLILYSALVMTEPLAALATLVSFWLAARKPGNLKWLAASALVLGLAALVRPQALLCLPFLALVEAKHWLSPTFRFSWSWARACATRVAIVAVCTFAPIAPWTIRNCKVMDSCALVSTNGGWNLAIGSFPRATGRFETLRTSDGCSDVVGQVQQDRCWLQYGVEHIKRDPWRWIHLMPVKLSQTFDHESFAVGYLREARPSAWPNDKVEQGRAVMTASHVILLVLACFATATRARRPAMWVHVAVFGAIAIGALSEWRSEVPSFWPFAIVAATLPFVPLPTSSEKPPALWLGAAFLLTTCVTHAIFFGEDRYHMVLTPVFALLAAASFRRAPTAA
jgi:hypothetical protein